MLIELVDGRECHLRGAFFQLEGVTMPLKPLQKPHPPVWLGGGLPDAVRRAATVADGWIGSGGSRTATLPDACPSSGRSWKRSGATPGASQSRSACSCPSTNARKWPRRGDPLVHHVYRSPAGTYASGVYGTPEEVRERLDELVALGANHLLLNPICRYAEHVEALAAAVGLPS